LSFAAGDVIEASSPTAGALSFAVPSMTTSRVAWNRILDAIDSRDGHALGEHVERLKTEGSDASQAQETLQIVSRNLGNLYVQQSVMRQTAWAWHSTKAG
jgi:hypothetical protein